MTERKPVYIYWHHTGGFYFDSKPIPYEKRYCKICHDVDIEMGQASSPCEAFDMISNEFGDTEYFGRWDGLARTWDYRCNEYIDLLRGLVKHWDINAKIPENIKTASEFGKIVESVSV